MVVRKNSARPEQKTWIKNSSTLCRNFGWTGTGRSTCASSWNDTWILLRGQGQHVQFWSKEEREWQTGDAGQAKYMFETPQEAWEHYKQHLYEPPAWHSEE
jgi:hypothetical protein